MTYIIIILGTLISLISILEQKKPEDRKNTLNIKVVLSILYLAIMILMLISEYSGIQKNITKEERDVKVEKKVTNIDSLLMEQNDTINSILNHNDTLIKNLKEVQSNTKALILEGKKYNSELRKIRQISIRELEIKQTNFELDAPEIILLNLKIDSFNEAYSQLRFKFKNIRNRTAYQVKYNSIVLKKDLHNNFHLIHKGETNSPELKVSPQGSNGFFVEALSPPFEFLKIDPELVEVYVLIKVSYFDKETKKVIVSNFSFFKKNLADNFYLYEGHNGFELDKYLKEIGENFQIPI